MAILEGPIKGIREVRNHISGEWVDSKGKIVDVVNPATGKVMGKCPISTKEEINAAMEAAKAAFPDWRKTTPLARTRILFRMKFILTKDPEFGSLTLPSSLLTFLKLRGACGRTVLPYSTKILLSFPVKISTRYSYFGDSAEIGNLYAPF